MRPPGGFRIVPFPRARSIARAAARATLGTYVMRGLVEVDVTVPRALLRERKQRTGDAPSLTAFLIACVARAVDANKIVQARHGRRGELVVFDDVDVFLQVEREHDGQKVAVPFVLRAANRKTVDAIHAELRAERARPVELAEARSATWVARLPDFVQDLLFRLARKRPLLAKEHAGTIEVSALGMFGKHAGWGLHVPVHPLTILTGGVTRKPAVVDDRVEIRELLHLTITFDHDAVDGAPAARFTEQLLAAIERGEGLLEQRAAPEPCVN